MRMSCLSGKPRSEKPVLDVRSLGCFSPFRSSSIIEVEDRRGTAQAPFLAPSQGGKLQLLRRTLCLHRPLPPVVRKSLFALTLCTRKRPISVGAVSLRVSPGDTIGLADASGAKPVSVVVDQAFRTMVLPSAALR